MFTVVLLLLLLQLLIIIIIITVIIIIIQAQWRPQSGHTAGPTTWPPGLPLSLPLGLEGCFLQPHVGSDPCPGAWFHCLLSLLSVSFRGPAACPRLPGSPLTRAALDDGTTVTAFGLRSQEKGMTSPHPRNPATRFGLSPENAVIPLERPHLGCLLGWLAPGLPSQNWGNRRLDMSGAEASWPDPPH